MEKVTITKVGEQTTFVFQAPQSMTSTRMGTSMLGTCMALSMKSVITAGTHSKEVFMTMMHLASSATSAHVVQC